MAVASVPTQTDMAKERMGEPVTEDEARKEMEYTAQREEERRDLLGQVSGIDQEEQAEILFEDTTPRRAMAIIYATLDGEPLVVTRKRARKLLERTLPDGRPMFTGNPANAPEYRKGNVKCFLHKDSDERELMNSLGLQGKFCPAGQLANSYAKFVHERGKHVKTYEIWEKHVEGEKETAAIERQDRQFEATMAQNAAILELARGNQAGGTEAVTPAVESVGTETRCASCNEVIEGKLADHHC